MTIRFLTREPRLTWAAAPLLALAGCAGTPAASTNPARLQLANSAQILVRRSYQALSDDVQRMNTADASADLALVNGLYRDVASKISGAGTPGS